MSFKTCSFENSSCSICLKNLNYKRVFYKCGHFYCLLCFCRMAFLKKEISCFCSNSIIEINFFPSEIKKEVIHRKVKLICSEEALSFIYNLLKCVCIICSKNFSDKKILQNHLKEKHGKVFCTICIENSFLFSFEYSLYSFNNLVEHKKGNHASCIISIDEQIKNIKEDLSNFYGHPKCKFCSFEFFDAEVLKRHCNQKHFICKVCLTNRDYRYFKTKEQLKYHLLEFHCFLSCCSKDLTDSDMYVHNEFLLMQHKIKFHNKKSTPINFPTTKKEDINSFNPFYLKQKNEEKNISDDKKSQFLKEKLIKKTHKSSIKNNSPLNVKENNLIEKDIERKNYVKVSINLNLQKTVNKEMTLENINKEVQKYLNGELSFKNLLETLKILISENEIISLFSTYKNFFEEFKDAKFFDKIIDELKFPPYEVKQKPEKLKKKTEEKKLSFKIFDL